MSYFDDIFGASVLESSRGYIELLDFDEDQHPRDDHGRFATSYGHWVSANGETHVVDDALGHHHKAEELLGKKYASVEDAMNAAKAKGYVRTVGAFTKSGKATGEDFSFSGFKFSPKALGTIRSMAERYHNSGKSVFVDYGKDWKSDSILPDENFDKSWKKLANNLPAKGLEYARRRGMVLSYADALLKDDDFEGKHPRDDHGRFGSKGTRDRKIAEKTPRPSAKSLIARANAVLITSEHQRYAEEHNEPVLAKSLGGSSLRDNEPADVIVARGGVIRHGVELKTVINGQNDKLTMKASAMERKAQWMRENRADFHTVVFDDRKVFNAGGPGLHDDSNREMYYRRGFGSFRLGTMHKVGSMAELTRLINTPSSELPDAAKPGDNYPKIRRRS